jgi:hypothetical protein
MGYWVDGWCSIPGSDKYFLYPTASRLILRLTQPPIECILGARQPGRKADHSSPSSVEAKNGGAIFPLPPYVSIAWWSVIWAQRQYSRQTRGTTCRLEVETVVGRAVQDSGSTSIEISLISGKTLFIRSSAILSPYTVTMLRDFRLFTWWAFSCASWLKL